MDGTSAGFILPSFASRKACYMAKLDAANSIICFGIDSFSAMTESAASNEAMPR